MIELPSVTLVVIGRNEENNLEAAFRAIESIDYPRNKLEIIYVDSNSTDRSVEIARQYADAVFAEDHPLPSAARGRNRGLFEAKNDIVHFIDGDVQIDPGYLKKAVAVLRDPDIHAVCGYIQEKNDRGWNRIISGSWRNPQEGFIQATATGGTYRLQPLLQINGYDERVMLGEETELGERFLNAGFRIWSIKGLMGTHDYGAIGVMDYVRLGLKDGKSKTRLLLLPDRSAFFKSNRHYARNNVYHIILLILFWGIVIYFQKWLLLPIILVFSLALILFKYMVIRRVRDKVKIVYYLLMNLAKQVVFVGQLSEWIKIKTDRVYRESLQQDKMVLSK